MDDYEAYEHKGRSDEVCIWSASEDHDEQQNREADSYLVNHANKIAYTSETYLCCKNDARVFMSLGTG